MTAQAFCYVVVAHESSGTERLVRRIRAVSPGARVLVRFEDPDAFDAAALRRAGAIPFVSRVRVRWGTWSLTEAMLEALGQAQAMTGASHYVLISGQDYPIRDLRRWEAGLTTDGVDALLEPIADHPQDWRFRWHAVDVTRPRHAGAYRLVRHAGWRLGTVTRPVVQILPRFTATDRHWLIGVARPWARPPRGLRVTKCSQWMMLSQRALTRVLERHQADPSLATFFRTVRISDESYVQSLLHAEPGLRITHGETTLKRFPPGRSSPQWLDVATLRELAAGSTAPFARKVAPDAGPELFAAADALAGADSAAADSAGADSAGADSAGAESAGARGVARSGVA